MVCLWFGCFFIKYKQGQSWLLVPQDMNPCLIPAKVTTLYRSEDRGSLTTAR